MNPIPYIMTAAVIAAAGLSFTILSDFLIPILIAAAVFTVLVLMLIPKKD